MDEIQNRKLLKKLLKYRGWKDEADLKQKEKEILINHGIKNLPYIDIYDDGESFNVYFNIETTNSYHTVLIDEYIANEYHDGRLCNDHGSQEDGFVIDMFRVTPIEHVLSNLGCFIDMNKESYEEKFPEDQKYQNGLKFLFEELEKFKKCIENDTLYTYKETNIPLQCVPTIRTAQNTTIAIANMFGINRRNPLWNFTNNPNPSLSMLRPQNIGLGKKKNRKYTPPVSFL